MARSCDSGGVRKRIRLPMTACCEHDVAQIVPVPTDDLLRPAFRLGGQVLDGTFRLDPDATTERLEVA
jgi:hypothetical protein